MYHVKGPAHGHPAPPSKPDRVRVVAEDDGAGSASHSYVDQACLASGAPGGSLLLSHYRDLVPLDSWEEPTVHGVHFDERKNGRNVAADPVHWMEELPVHERCSPSLAIKYASQDRPRIEHPEVYEDVGV